MGYVTKVYILLCFRYEWMIRWFSWALRRRVNTCTAAHTCWKGQSSTCMTSCEWANKPIMMVTAAHYKYTYVYFCDEDGSQNIIRGRGETEAELLYFGSSSSLWAITCLYPIAVAIRQESNQAYKVKREWWRRAILQLIYWHRLNSRGRSLPRTFDSGRLRLYSMHKCSRRFWTCWTAGIAAS